MNVAQCLAPLALVTLVSLAACDKRDDAAPAKSAAFSTTPTDAVKPAPAPDNTAKNKGDGSSDARTPMDQSESSDNIKLTAEIRRAIMDDKVMSINAQNCKIITDKAGLVTLRGVVSSQAEKDSIEAKAKAIAGVAKVDNQLEVKTN